MLIGTYRRARRALIIPRLNWRKIYRNGEMISSDVKRWIRFQLIVHRRYTKRVIVRETIPAVSYLTNRRADISIRPESSVVYYAQSREIGKLSGTRELSSGKSVTSRYSA